MIYGSNSNSDTTTMTDTHQTPNSNDADEFDFGHLNIDVNSTRRYELGLVTPGAWIEGRPAQPDLNAAYRDGIISMPEKVERLRKELAGGGPDDAEKLLQREEDYVLFARTIVTNWGGVRYRNGKLVPFSADNVEKFLRALPTFLFDRITLFFKSLEAFVSPLQLPPREDIKKSAGNS